MTGKRKLSHAIAIKALPAWLLLASLGGCAVEKSGIDWNSGGDHKRDLAKLLPLGRVITDSINAPAGDHTDWKYIEVPENGQLQLELTVDNPKVAGIMTLYDSLGQAIQQHRVNGVDRNYAFSRNVAAGRYFFEMRASANDSVYSVGAYFEPEVREVIVVAPPPPPPPPEPEPEKPVVVRDRRPRRPPRKPAPEPAPEPTVRTVQGRIINIVQGTSDRTARVTFDKGTGAGVKRGTRVSIAGGPSGKIADAYESASVAIVPAAPEDLKRDTRVTFTLDD